MTTDNENLVQQAMAELIATGDVDSLAHLLSDDFVHHRPDATSSTKADWLDAVGQAMSAIADMKVNILQVMSDGDHVVMHSQRLLPDGPEIAVVDIWRFDAGLIAEAWEIIEPVAHAAANLQWWEVPRHDRVTGHR